MTLSYEDALKRLKELFATIGDIESSAAVLEWDRQTFMPEGGVETRAEQLATLSRLAHEMVSSPEVGELLAALPDPGEDTPDEAMVRNARREHERAVKLPPELVSEMARQTARAQAIWERAREESRWSLFAPQLERLTQLQRRMAEELGYEDHPYDALLDLYERGATGRQMQTMFEELKDGLVGLLERIPDDAAERQAPLEGEFDEAKQEEFARGVISAFGYDFTRGRLDRSTHPFTIGFGAGDVRITTRYSPRSIPYSLFSTLHEAGHALYEQGIPPEYDRTPLAGGVSMGIHESQSRLWENLVGRSRPFWSHYYPRLQKVFPQLKAAPEEFYRGINAVERSPIRTESDELTYNLHILLRFELELALMDEEIEVAELPQAWNARMEEYLGITPQNNAEGVLQDVHWAAGLFGYFPTYSIGNVLSAQLFSAAVEAHPGIPNQMEEGDFSELGGWLRENIHRHGSRYEPQELITMATGGPLEAGPYLSYLHGKFGDLYDL